MKTLVLSPVAHTQTRTHSRTQFQRLEDVLGRDLDSFFDEVAANQRVSDDSLFGVARVVDEVRQQHILLARLAVLHDFHPQDHSRALVFVRENAQLEAPVHELLDDVLDLDIMIFARDAKELKHLQF